MYTSQDSPSWTEQTCTVDPTYAKAPEPARLKLFYLHKYSMRQLLDRFLLTIAACFCTESSTCDIGYTGSMPPPVCAGKLLVTFWLAHCKL